MVFSPEHPKRDQSPKSTPLSKMTSIVSRPHSYGIPLRPPGLTFSSKHLIRFVTRKFCCDLQLILLQQFSGLPYWLHKTTVLIWGACEDFLPCSYNVRRVSIQVTSLGAVFLVKGRVNQTVCCLHSFLLSQIHGKHPYLRQQCFKFAAKCGETWNLDIIRYFVVRDNRKRTSV